MFRDDRYRVAVRAAVEATRASIRRDRAQAPRVIRRLFTVLASKFFHSGLDAGKAWSESGIRDRSLVAVFRDFTGMSVGRYIAKRRIEVAHVLMMTTDLDLCSISERVGYTYHPTFSKNYERLKGKRPCDVERPRLPPPPLIDDETALRAVRGLLDKDEAPRFMADLRQIYPGAAVRVDADIAPPEPRVIINGKRSDRLEAEEIWRAIRDLPFDEQCRRVRGYCFHSKVLFDLLRKKSRVEGRKKRQRGIEIAKLALVSLEDSDEIFGERIHDLRAHGWACLGNAHRLAHDFSAATAAFEQADREWSTPRTQPDPLVLAHILIRKGALRMMRREYVEATHDVDRSCTLFRQLHQTRDEALALIKRATIHGYAGRIKDAVKDLHEAAYLVSQDEEMELAFAIRGNLANALVRAGKGESASKQLNKARQLSRAIDDPLGAIKLDWIAGDLSELRGDLKAAERFYIVAREGFGERGEKRDFGMVSVDLMTIHSQQGDWNKVGVLALETLPVLTSLRLHRETVTTVGLLSQAVEAGSFSHRLLKDLQIALRQDPLIS